MPTGNSTAFYYGDQQAFGGAIQPNDTGFTWNLVAVFREPATGRKNTVTGITAQTLDGDTLLQIGQKLGAAVKAEGLARDYSVTVVAFHPINTMAV